MDSLPLELIRHVYSFLPPGDRFNCLFVCKRFLTAAVVRSLPPSSTLRLRLGDCPSTCNFSPSEALFSVCSCGRHGALDVLDHVLPHLLKAFKSLEVEDELARGSISDEDLYELLARCVDAPLTRLAMVRCDLAQVRPWTLALLARFDQLKELTLDGCQLSLSENQLIRAIAPAFTTLTNVEIKNSPLVTDKMARRLAVSCPLLEAYKVTGCASVTALSALAFIEAALRRTNPTLNMYVEDTAFDADLLYRCMKSPLFPSGPDWRLRGTQVSIGFQRHAVLAEHRNAICVLIYV